MKNKIILVFVALIICVSFVSAVEIDDCMVIDEEGEYVLTEDILLMKKMKYV